MNYICQQIINNLQVNMDQQDGLEQWQHKYDRYVDLKTLCKNLSTLSKRPSQTVIDRLAKSKSKCETRCFHKYKEHELISINSNKNQQSPTKNENAQTNQQDFRNITMKRLYKCKTPNSILSPVKYSEKESVKFIHCKYVGLTSYNQQINNNLGMKNKKFRKNYISPLQVVIKKKKQIQPTKPEKFYNYSRKKEGEDRNLKTNRNSKSSSTFQQKLIGKKKQFEQLQKFIESQQLRHIINNNSQCSSVKNFSNILPHPNEKVGKNIFRNQEKGTIFKNILLRNLQKV